MRDQPLIDWGDAWKNSIKSVIVNPKKRIYKTKFTYEIGEIVDLTDPAFYEEWAEELRQLELDSATNLADYLHSVDAEPEG